jgi:hypothetical protein
MKHEDWINTTKTRVITIDGNQSIEKLQLEVNELFSSLLNN